MTTLERDFKAVEACYGKNVLHLTLAGAYIRKLLATPNVPAFLRVNYNGIHAEFEAIAKTESL